MGRIRCVRQQGTIEEGEFPVTSKFSLAMSPYSASFSLLLQFTALVDRADQLIKDLPWGKDFEVSKFTRPDFTALEILSFATSGIPAGINVSLSIRFSVFHDERSSDQAFLLF